MKILGFNHGLNGDAVMSTIACRVIKELYPKSELTFALSKSYSKILELFKHHPHIDKFHIWDGNDSGLTTIDADYINDGNFDMVFDPFPKHHNPDWYNYFHYGNEVLRMHNLPMTHDLQCHLNPYFGKSQEYHNWVSISAFPSKSTNLSKTLSLDKWALIVRFINKLGYNCIQLGGEFDLQIHGAKRPTKGFGWLSAAQALYSSKLHISTDSAFGWIGSAYQHNTVGLYGCNYPDMVNPWSHLPVNPNARYLWKRDINDIPLELILETIEEKLK